VLIVSNSSDSIRPEELITFDMYFASVRSMQFHPGAGTKEHTILTREQCAQEALEMIKLRRIMAGADAG
jgi:hypothetical protein